MMGLKGLLSRAVSEEPADVWTASIRFRSVLPISTVWESERNNVIILLVWCRKKQASAEAKRLNLIQEELQKLDQRLSGDVSIIRNQIESASIEFLEAQ